MCKFDALDMQQGLWQWMGREIVLHVLLHAEVSITVALDQSQQVSWRILARGEVTPCCLLSELWQATPSTAGHRGRKQREQNTDRCMDSGCGQWEMDESEKEV